MVPYRFLVPMLLVTVSACLQDSTDESSFDPARVKAEDLDHYVERVMAEQGVPGMSIAVVRGGEILRAKGYGFASLEPRAPATAQSLYGLGSTAIGGD